MTKKFGKIKKQVRASTREQKKLESESHDIPRTMIFCKSGAGNVVRQLVEDFKSIMEPYTTTTLKCTSKNKMKDFIDHAGPLNVKNIIYFTEKKDNKKTQIWNESTNYELGGVYCHIICVPHGPTFTYKLKEYALKKDIQNVSGFCMNNNWLQQPPLIILNGFGSVDCDQHLKAVSSSWQNMLPTINVNKTRIHTLRRAVLLSRHSTMPDMDEKIQAEWGEVFVLRHYNIRLENKELSKSVRKLGVGAASRNTKIPDLSKYGSIEEFMTQSGHISESDMSDIEEPATVELIEKMKELPGTSGKTAIKMMEVGPRITMQLLKIEAGVHSGAILYHRYITKTAEEVFENDKIRREKLRLKEQRRKEQEKNVAEKKKVKDGRKEKVIKKKKEDDESESDASLEEDGDMDKEAAMEIEDGNEVDIEEDNVSECVEDVEDSMDEIEDDVDEELGDIENVEDSMDEIEEDVDEESGDIENVEDSVDEEDSEEGDENDSDVDALSDLGEDDGAEDSDFEIKEDIKKVNPKKRQMENDVKISKKRRC